MDMNKYMKLVLENGSELNSGILLGALHLLSEQKNCGIGQTDPALHETQPTLFQAKAM